jgi:hypothetical protein
MKKFLIAGLFTALGAVALMSQASAASRYCIYNPDDPACYEPDYYGGDGYPPPDYGAGDGYDYPPPPPPYPRNHRRDYNDQGPVFSFQFSTPARGSCSGIGQALRRSGFRRVQPIDCAGREYAYIAFRDGQRLRVTVGSNDGRIHNIRRQ